MGLSTALQRRWWWIVTCIAMSNGYFMLGIIYSYGVLFGAIQEEFNSSTVVTGWVQSLCLCCGQLFSVTGQLLISRFGYFNVIAPAMYLNSLFFLLSSFVSSDAQLYITYGLGVGITTAIVTKGGIQLTLDWAPSHYRVRASTLATFGCTVGLVTISPILETLSTQFGWRGSLKICSASVFSACLLVTPLLYITEKKQKQKLESVKRKRGTRDSYNSQRDILCFPEILIFGLMIATTSCAQGFTAINLVDFTTKSGFTLGQGTIMLSINGGFEVFGKLIIAIFIDKFHYPKILLWPHGCIVAAVCCISLLYVKSFEGFLVVSAVIGLVKSVFNGTPYVAGSELLSPRYQASVASLGSVPFGLGYLFSALIGGFSYDLTGSYDSALYTCSGLYLFACTLALCTLLWQKTFAIERYQFKPGRKTEHKTKDYYTEFNVIEDKLQSTNDKKLEQEEINGSYTQLNTINHYLGMPQSCEHF